MVVLLESSNMTRILRKPSGFVPKKHAYNFVNKGAIQIYAGKNLTRFWCGKVGWCICIRTANLYYAKKLKNVQEWRQNYKVNFTMGKRQSLFCCLRDCSSAKNLTPPAGACSSYVMTWRDKSTAVVTLFQNFSIQIHF